MGAIFRREVSSYFISPIGYIFLAGFYCCTGVIFSQNSLQYGSTKLDRVFADLILVLIVLIPILTMKTISEEKKQKTDQCLLTSPVSLGGIVAGKFFASFLIYTLGVAITFVYAVVVSAYAKPDWNVIVGNIAGLLLLGAAYIAVGIFCSSLTENQIVAAVISFFAMVLLYLLSTVGNLIPIDTVGKVLDKLCFWNRYYDFTLGLFDMSNVLFFVSAAVAFLFLTVRVLEKRRWS